MSVSNSIMVLDAIIGTLNTVTKTTQLLIQLEQEGRDIGADELMRLTQATNAQRAAWDEAYAKLLNKPSSS